MEHAQHVGEAAERGELTRRIMRRQAALALKVAAVFVLILVGLPLLNLYLPDMMATQIGGFSLTWLLLAVLFYPITWLLSFSFVKGSDRIEAAIVAEVRAAERTAPTETVALAEGTETIPAPQKRKLFVEDEE